MTKRPPHSTFTLKRDLYFTIRSKSPSFCINVKETFISHSWPRNIKKTLTLKRPPFHNHAKESISHSCPRDFHFTLMSKRPSFHNNVRIIHFTFMSKSPSFHIHVKETSIAHSYKKAEKQFHFTVMSMSPPELHLQEDNVGGGGTRRGFT